MRRIQKEGKQEQTRRQRGVVEIAVATDIQRMDGTDGVKHWRAFPMWRARFVGKQSRHHIPARQGPWYALPQILCDFFRAVHNTIFPTHLDMAKPRTSLRNTEQNEVHEDGSKEEEPLSALEESMDPLEESGRTVDSSDEEVEDAVQEDMARFEETFVGISKRFRLINRIGEGASYIIGLTNAGNRMLTWNDRHLLNSLQG